MYRNHLLIFYGTLQVMMCISALLLIASYFMTRPGSCNELSRCCNGGDRFYKETGGCSNIRARAGTGSHCTRGASICCLRSLLNHHCSQGVQSAVNTARCPSRIDKLGGGIAKECCDCCMLAKELTEKGSECAAPSAFSQPCLESFKVCCTQSYSKTTKINQPISDIQSSNVGREDEEGRGQMRVRGDRCPASKCEHLCTDSPGALSVNCSCRSGYTLAANGYSCIDIDECRQLRDQCTEGQRCLNLNGTYRCIRVLSCGTGYFLDSNQICIDVDECALNTHDCGTDYRCRNTQGSYKCDPQICPQGELLDPTTRQCSPIHCPPGFSPAQNGKCQDVNECEDVAAGSRCEPFEDCINTVGSFRCKEKADFCSDGYYIDRLTSFCIDKDECSEGTHTCDSEAQCMNVEGSYKCRCRDGFQFNEATKQCEDVDECQKFGGHVCSEQATCQNEIGSFKCKCKTGFTLAADQRNCEDVNECETGEHKCQQKCINIPGSYQCVCDRGYTLDINGTACQDIDECSVWAGSGDDLCMGGCVNTPGSYKCQCPSGYAIEDDHRTCKDVDECSRGECQGSDQICVNTLGSFKCHQVSCPLNYERDQHNKKVCHRKKVLCSKGDFLCKSKPVKLSWQYNAIPRHIRFGRDRTQVTLFTITGPSTTTQTVQFELTLRDAKPGTFNVKRARRSNFLLQRGRTRNSVTVSLRDSLDGPQEVHLELLMSLHHFSLFKQKFLANLIVYVSAQRLPKPITIYSLLV